MSFIYTCTANCLRSQPGVLFLMWASKRHVSTRVVHPYSPSRLTEGKKKKKEKQNKNTFTECASSTAHFNFGLP